MSLDKSLARQGAISSQNTGKEFSHLSFRNSGAPTLSPRSRNNGPEEGGNRKRAPGPGDYSTGSL